MRIAGLAAAALAAGLLAAAEAATQDRGGKAPPGPTCDMKGVVARDYCAKCDKELAKDDIEKGKCKSCESKVDKIEICVKKCYSADCHPDKIKDKPGT